jgi:hypothetical protein
MRRWARRSLAVVAAASALVMGMAGASRASAPAVVRPIPVVAAASAYADGFKIQAKTTYTLDPPGGAVHVAFDVTITNQKPDQIVGSYIRQFYLPNFGVPVLVEAAALRAVKSDGTELPVSVEPSDSPRFSIAVVDMRPDLYYPGSQSFRFTYDLPKQAPRSDGFTRLNDAYATFPMIAVGDPGLTDVEVVVPKAFEVELVGDEMAESERDGKQVFTATAIDDPLAWGVLVSARDDTKLIERTVDLGEEDVNVLGWPDDPEWADFAAEQVTDGVPVIEDLIGLEWPATSTLDLVETASPYLYGYAGWFSRFERLIEVGDELDQQVVLHELAHLWFNDGLFEGRWINEAFADQIAALAMAELGEKQPTPKQIDLGDPGRLKLNDWSDPDLQAGASDDQERYGYNASWSVLHAVVDEIGTERLAEIIQAAEAGQIAYRGPGVPEELVRTFDWRELLDLFEEIGGSAKAASLFERYVVGEDEAADFEARAAARERYAALLEAGDGWAAPTSIRLAMTDWRFDAVEGLINDATEVLATKADLLEVTADLDVADDLALQDTYEAGKDMAAVAADADEALAAARVLQSAEDAMDKGAGPLGAVGLAFADVGADLERAQAAFDKGDYAAVRAAAADVESAMDGAMVAGLVRLVGLVLLLVVSYFVRKAMRARRSRRAVEPVAEPRWSPPAPAGEAADAEALEADRAQRVGGPPDGGGEVGV